MGDTKIIVISLRRPQAILRRFQQALGLAPGKAGSKLSNALRLFKEKNNNKKA